MENEVVALQKPHAAELELVLVELSRQIIKIST